uniref:Uncharacterized protein n=1 Tax=Arundo donax TaxID=35708 RepID=A0A0A8Y6I1_ARUDO
MRGVRQQRHRPPMHPRRAPRSTTAASGDLRCAGATARPPSSFSRPTW